MGRGYAERAIRADSTQADGHYALAMVLCFAATLYWAQARRGSAYLVGAAASILMLGAIGITYFRAAWIAALIVVVAAFGLRPKRFARVLAVGGLILALLLLASSRIEQSPSKLSTRLNDTQNVSGRLATYQVELSLFKANPEKYEEVSKYQVKELEAPCWAPPVLSHGLLYVRGKGKLLCLELLPEAKK